MLVYYFEFVDDLENRICPIHSTYVISILQIKDSQ